MRSNAGGATHFSVTAQSTDVFEWLQLTLAHPFVSADQVPRRLAKNGAPAILHRAPEVFVAPSPAARRIMRRTDHVRQVEKRVTHREPAVPHRLHPPCVDAGEKERMSDKMRVERRLVDDPASRDVNEHRVLLHQVKLAGTDQTLGGSRQRGADDEDVGNAQHLVETVSRRYPIGWLVAPAAAVDCVKSSSRRRASTAPSQRRHYPSREWRRHRPAAFGWRCAG